MLNRLLARTGIVLAPILLALAYMADGRAAEDRPDPYRDAARHLQELEALLAQAEKGEKVDLDKVADLVPKSRKTCRDEPGDEGGLVAWNELTARLAKAYPRTVQQLIRRGVYGADRFLWGLGDAGGDANVEFLSQFLDERLARLRARRERGEKEDPDWLVHHAIVLALGRSKSQQAWPALRKALGCESLCALAVNALAAAGDMSIVPMLSEWLASKDAGKQGLALRAVVSLSNDRTKKELAEKLLGQIKLLFEPSGHIKQSAAKALASLGDDAGLAVLHEMALDESEYVKCVEMLERSPDPWRGRYPPTNYTQNEALDAIAKLASQKSAPVLLKLAREAKDERVRERASKIIADKHW